MGAALIASMVKVAAAAQAPHADDPARVLAGIHLALASDLPRAHFVITAVYASADLDLAMLRYASAGHPPPLVWRAGELAMASPGETGPLIISFAPVEYSVTDLALAPGDRAVFYTDGIVEAAGPGDEMFGVERLSAFVAAAQNGPGTLVTDVVSAVSRFTRRARAFDDDCTIVALGVRSDVRTEN